MAHVESNPYLKAATPQQVIKNLKDMAVSYYHSSQTHFDLRMDIPKGFSIISTDTSSVSSRLSRLERFGEEEEGPKDIFTAEEMEFEKEKREVEELEKRVALKKQLAERKRKAKQALEEEEEKHEDETKPKT
jgi:hypothetical protein